MLSGIAYNSSGQSMHPQLKMYYNLKNSGDDAIYHDKDTANALVFYDLAFNLFTANFDSSFCDIVPDLIRFHGYQNNSEKVYKYIRYSIQVNHTNELPEYYMPSEWNKCKEYTSFRNSKYWQLFVKEHDSLYKAAVSGLDWKLIYDYITHDRLDHFVRQGELENTRKLSMDSGYNYNKIYFAVVHDIDRYNLLNLARYIKEGHFLNYEETGGRIGLSNMVLMHTFRSCMEDSSIAWTYKYIDSALLSKVFAGKYPAAMYAFHKDRSYSYLCRGPQKYGLWSGGTGQIINGLMDVKNVDAIRAEIGLPCLYIQSLKDGFKLPVGYEVPAKYK